MIETRDSGGTHERDMPVPERFWSRVDKTNTCWLWKGSHTSAGYGNLRLPDGTYDYAHRVSYRFHKGSIPTGLHLDHLCRVRDCVNPDHLEAVTAAENIRRGAAGYGSVRSTCRRGHDITLPENVYTEPTGSRRCRVCAKESGAARKAARHARGDLRKVLQTHCRRGHEYTPQNTAITTTGHRRCRKCNALYAANKRKEKRDSVRSR